MTKQIVNIGTSADKGNGDPLRTAFQKINDNFTELYSALGTDIQIPIQTGNDGKYLTTNGTTLSWGTITQGSSDRLVNSSHSAILGSNGYLTMESLYLQGYLKGVDGNTGLTGQVLTRQSNGGAAWANATGGSSGANVTTDITPPSSPSVGDLWYDTVGGRMYVYFDSTWVDTNPAVTESINLTTLKSIVAASTDFANFQTRIAAL